MESLPIRESTLPASKIDAYPLEVFPALLQDFLQEGISGLQWVQNYSCPAMMTALAHAIGTSYSAQVKERFIEPCITWSMIVGSRGSNKTHSVEEIFRPINDRVARLYAEHRNKLQNSTAEQSYEMFRPALTTDTTLEGLTVTMQSNPKGVLLHNDEILSLMGNLNRYDKKSNNEPYLLSSWGGAPLNSTRKTQDCHYVEKSCINIFGGIQPELVTDLLSKKRLYSGFADRILFSCTDEPFRSWDEETSFNQRVYNDYNRVIKELLDTPPNVSVLRFNQEAKALLFNWQRENTAKAQQYRAENNPIFGVLRKYESYVSRLSLILEVSTCVCDKRKPELITLPSVERAIQAVDFHVRQYAHVLGLTACDPALASVPEAYRILYRYLPEKFDRQAALSLASDLCLQLCPRSIDNFLANLDLFAKPQHNSYRKKLG